MLRPNYWNEGLGLISKLLRYWLWVSLAHWLIWLIKHLFSFVSAFPIIDAKQCSLLVNIHITHLIDHLLIIILDKSGGMLSTDKRSFELRRQSSLWSLPLFKSPSDGASSRKPRSYDHADTLREAPAVIRGVNVTSSEKKLKCCVLSLYTNGFLFLSSV